MADFHEGQRVRVAGLVGARGGESVPVTGTVRLASSAAGVAWVALDAVFGGGILPLPVARLEAVDEVAEQPAAEQTPEVEPTPAAAEHDRLAFYRWMVQSGRLEG